MAIVSAGTHASTRPYSMAQGRNGNVYAVNGLGRGLRWDGTTLWQIGVTAAPTISAASYAPSDSKFYYIDDFTIEDPGENYVSPPSVSIVGATGPRVSVSGGGVDGLAITTSSTTYATSPYVTFTGGQATGATLAVTCVGGVASVDLPYGAVGYFSSAPQISFAANPGVTVLRDAKAYGVINFATTGATSGRLAGVIVTDPGRYAVPADFINYARPLAVTSLIDADGANFSHLMTPRFSGFAATVAISAAGTEYTTPPTVEVFSAGEDTAGSGAVVECAVSGGKITAATIVQPGSGYDGRLRCTVSSRPAQARATMRPRFTGRYLCGIRYVDSTPASQGGPIPGDMSPLVEVDCSPGAQSITWSLPATQPTDGTPNRIASVELWRTTSDQAITLYRVAVLDASSLPQYYGDSVADDQLAGDLAMVPHLFVAEISVTSGGTGYTSGTTVVFENATITDPPITKVAVAGGAVKSVTVEYGGVFPDYSFPTVAFQDDAGSGAKAKASMAYAYTPRTQEPTILPILTADGFPSASRFGVPPSQMAVVCMWQDRAWYTVDTTGAEPNAIYFSEVDEPESVPEAYQLLIQQNGREPDRITGLIPFDSSLYVGQSRNLLRLTVAGHPLDTASVTPVAQRGLLNDRCWDTADGVAYIADDSGLYAFTGNSVEPLSDPVSSYWTDPLIDFSKSAWFFVRADASANIVRFFYVAAGSAATYPDRAICYSTTTKAWWTEEYADEVACAVTVRRSGRQRISLGGASKLYEFESGTSDAGQPIAYSMRTGNLPLNAKDRRGLRLTYTPLSVAGTLGVRVLYNGSTTPVSFAVDSDQGTGFVTVAGSTEASLDLSSSRSSLANSNGYAQLWLSGRMDDKSAGGDRHVAIELAGTHAGASVTVHRMDIEGAG